ncbi:MAG: NYN domain-containing protein [Phycisphaerales bacterium]|nr:NYN domain-containing protein [Planctomycetota bacterium]MCH8509202.1 NYN domain-containing protein [Phycisphaerales bacterium]
MLLVDAFNVVRAQWVLPPARRGLDVRGLIELIGRSRFANRRLRVIVDGRPSPWWLRHGVYDTLAGHAWTRLGRAEVVFSGREQEADDVIEAVLARSEGLAITVVSSDRRLIAAAAAAGADQIGNGSFLRQINADLDRAEAAAEPPGRPEVPLDHHAVAHWMREFGYEPILLARPAEPPPPEKPTPAPKRVRAEPAFGSGLGLDGAGLPPAAPEPVEPLDPLLREAFEEWYGVLHLGDLDMRKWVDGVEPMDGR